MALSFRKLDRSDYGKGFLQILNQLAPVRDFSKEFFDRIYDEFQNTPGKHVYVGEIDNKLVCTGTLLVERKFFFNGSNFGHIEDIVVDSSLRGTGVGKKLIDRLIEDGKESKCIRLVLDCVDDKKDFYAKCGFYRKGNQMNLEFGK
ncbi:putative glucosamine 6-phosphate N-acetyltransferase 2 [Tritrichomonas foetus]|uniref:Glucosamine 6-phosphate N-acetyltransferase n=1 Tax=Tritrichomonas foetus TaxID=1144522 RepID=A0A1J4KER7_9EUKA|nr:putative glucosamine 6-phosphate N-acetyltransferase 2 [Tritrichomonas foetus]|eukprot:OHT09514.1 putative glucosamine 6-phosphate N-acetyltransferase 2 [Tritrichomonas foetus]